MKSLGIVAEYNPFHNGHKYHIDKSKAISNADCVISVMSGNITQRGELAYMDKWTRSRLAVDNGVDLVIELPFVFACNNAEIFARGAVDILAEVGCSIISFGSESGDLNELKDYIFREGEFKELISAERKNLMKSGMSFAKANEIAVEKYLGSASSELIKKPNNILAIEYLRRIEVINNNGGCVTPLTVKRFGSGYNDVNTQVGYAGASAIRRMLNINRVREFVPENTALEVEKKMTYKDADRELFKLIKYEIIKKDADDLSKIYRLGEGLENKLKKEIIKASNLDDFISSIVSKRYPEAMIRRCLMYILMDIERRELPEKTYARTLAFSDRGRRYLRQIKKRDDIKIPIVTNINKDNQKEKSYYETLKYDILSSDIYNLVMSRDNYMFSDKVVRPYVKDI